MTGSHLPLLLRLEARRLSAAIRRPYAASLAGVALPAALLVGGLWAGGKAVRPDVGTGDGQMLLGLLAAAPVALQAYGVLFRPADDSFLRRIGISPRASFGVRALRLLAVAALTVAALMIPFVSTGQPMAVPLAGAAAAALLAWVLALWTFSGAAERTVAPGYRPGLLAQSMGFDPDLVAAGPLVFAPILPAMSGGFAAILVGSGFVPFPAGVAALAVLGVPVLSVARRRFERGYPRFAPHAGELAYAPPADAGGSELVAGRGLARLLPRRAGAVRARDAVVIGRRFRWTGRAAWPVAAFSALALLRTGDDAAVRGWVVAACGVLLAAQAAAVVSLGRSERGRARWLDRAAGVRNADRLLGRWAAAFWLALGVALPVALAWSLSAAGSPGWWWIAGAASLAALASAASVAAAGR
ncbi:MAG TPA: hypothetical protein VEW03_14105 [Longimicrobiaceae bacterium]|nr:hypothetical protein [Longimicrobiaceae bacterium]